ncbi:MAG: hypothetical protein RBU37_07515 [Myxococcota bacterium]|jgi:hypothetical protein|nr:hypothetical protein [Myxococcota bacterium]
MPFPVLEHSLVSWRAQQHRCALALLTLCTALLLLLASSSASADEGKQTLDRVLDDSYQTKLPDDRHWSLPDFDEVELSSGGSDGEARGASSGGSAGARKRTAKQEEFVHRSFDFSGVEAFLRVLLSIVLVILLALLLVLVLRWWRGRERELEEEQSEDEETTPTALEEELQSAALQDYEALAARGEFGAAVHALFLRCLSQLVEREQRRAQHAALEDERLVSLRSLLRESLTARELLRGLSLQAEPRQAMNELLGFAELFRFAKRPLDANAYQRSLTLCEELRPSLEEEA